MMVRSDDSVRLLTQPEGAGGWLTRIAVLAGRMAFARLLAGTVRKLDHDMACTLLMDVVGVR
jgi:hypothetical protein